MDELIRIGDALYKLTKVIRPQIGEEPAIIVYEKIA